MSSVEPSVNYSYCIRQRWLGGMRSLLRLFAFILPLYALMRPWCVQIASLVKSYQWCAVMASTVSAHDFICTP